MRRLTRAVDAGEHGAMIPMVAVFSVVMVIMAALVIDVGALLDERRQLQNGADAAALGVAQYIAETCFSGPCTATTLRTRAEALANGNALDGTTIVDSVTPDFTTKKVTVRTSTRQRDGRTILPFQFGQAVAGSEGKSVRATAVATWAGLVRAKVIPLTMSRCEFDRATSNNTVFDVPSVIYFHEDKSANPCKTGSSGKDLPGGFGWLKDNNDSNSGDCNVTPTVTNTVQDDTGLPGTPTSCDMSTVLGKDTLVSIYGALAGTGSNGVYTIYGFGMFHVTGFRFPGETGGVVPCKAPSTCIGGTFIKFVGTGDYGGPNMGNRVALVS